MNTAPDSELPDSELPDSQQPDSQQPESLPGFDGIELLRWPEQDFARRSLLRSGIPRLLVLSGSSQPPEDICFDEDWIRAPYRLADLQARVRRLAKSLNEQSTTELWLDEKRILHRGNRTVVLTAFEAVVAAALLARPGEIVTRPALEQSLWSDQTAPGPRAVDAVVYRLRGRCRGLGITIATVRGQGFMLRTAASHRGDQPREQLS
ncbi:response regulator with CheY-like receiver domain and winged-helix DNA-binding domain [Actinobacteria bacterium IMCC26207]|nr:response regulator with CheY-like receiver domain and winged-helix DNA-binding domain [Actinobacteria bacterium IMCC26207]